MSLKNFAYTAGILLLCGIAYLIYQENAGFNNQANTATTTPEQTGNTTTRAFQSANKAITFAYINTLSVSERNNITTIHHEIDFPHTDACDFKGDKPDSPTLTDFHVTLQIYSMNIASTAVAVNPSLPTENLFGNVLKVSPGFIDTYNHFVGNGYKVTEGVEGCGQITYYLPLSSNRTLVIQKMLIGELSDLANPTQKDKILATPGAISASQADQIFSNIMNSLKAQ